MWDDIASEWDWRENMSKCDGETVKQNKERKELGKLGLSDISIAAHSECIAVQQSGGQQCG